MPSFWPLHKSRFHLLIPRSLLLICCYFCPCVINIVYMMYFYLILFTTTIIASIVCCAFYCMGCCSYFGIGDIMVRLNSNTPRKKRRKDLADFEIITLCGYGGWRMPYIYPKSIDGVVLTLKWLLSWWWATSDHMEKTHVLWTIGHDLRCALPWIRGTVWNSSM